MKNPSQKFEAVEMPGGEKVYVMQDEPYLRFNDVTRKHEIVVQEHVLRCEKGSDIFRQCYTNEIVLDYDANEKTIFEYRLKGRTEPDFPGRQ